jgi:hypothetical protein
MVEGVAGSIGNDAGLLRRIHPSQVVPDGNAGSAMRPSSAAFKDPNLSVDAEPMLIALGLDWKFSLKDNPAYSLVRFPAGAAREKGLAVIHKPIEENDAHTEVVGKKQRASQITFATHLSGCI